MHIIPDDASRNQHNKAENTITATLEEAAAKLLRCYQGPEVIETVCERMLDEIDEQDRFDSRDYNDQEQWR